MSEIASSALTSLPANAARSAIARAAQTTGVDFNYLLAQAKLESGLDTNARAGTSSATGLYQFLGSTWLDTLQKHGAEHGLGWAAATGGDPALRSQALALRTNPEVSALMAAELAGDNKTALSTSLGREPDSAELYLAHFLGAQGATQFLSALTVNPGQSAASLLPAAAGANRAIFFDRSGAPRSLGGVMDLLRGRLGAAMEGGDPDQWAAQFLPGTAAATPAAYPGGPIAQEFHGAAANAGNAAGAAQSPAPQLSMAETLKQTFGLGGAGDAAVPHNVRSAYGRLTALGF